MARLLVSPGPATLRDAIAAAQPGDTLALAPGTWSGPIILDKPVTLQPAGAFGSAVIQGGSGATVRVEADDSGPARPPRVTLRDLVIHGAADHVGPCLEQRNLVDTRIEGCLLTDGRGAGAGGGGVAVVQGRVTIVRSRIVGCRALRGGGVRASGAVRVVLLHSVVADCHGEDAGGALDVTGGASVALVGCTLGRNAAPEGRDIALTGATGGATTLRLDHTLLALDGAQGKGRIAAAGQARISVHRSALPPEAIATQERADAKFDERSLQRAVPVHADGADAWRPLLAALLAPIGDAGSLQLAETSAAMMGPEAHGEDVLAPRSAPVDLHGAARSSVFVGALDGAS